MPPKVFCWWESKAWSERAQWMCDHNSWWWISVTLTQQTQAETGSAVTSARPGSPTTLLRLCWVLWCGHGTSLHTMAVWPGEHRQQKQRKQQELGRCWVLTCCAQTRGGLSAPQLGQSLSHGSGAVTQMTSEEEKEEAETPSNDTCLHNKPGKTAHDHFPCWVMAGGSGSSADLG